MYCIRHIAFNGWILNLVLAVRGGFRVRLSWYIVKAAYFVPGLLCGSQDGYSNQQEEKGASLVLSRCPEFVKTMYAHQ